ncbi:OprD family porin [Pseudomonas sp.]|uniref:OprD family porin n=1 Tax=Pseudomonas sp. TaxID=306 RepID=UPI0028AC9994|nr:OprD family porin [Pseudomonas sp.]
MNNKKCVGALGIVGVIGPWFTLPQAAGFIEDSKVDLEARNFYMNRDFRDGSGQSKRDEWAQGFILRAQSGFTPGVVGFGLDAIAMVGLKLDSSPDRTGTGILPVHDDGRAPDEYSKAGLTAKIRASKTELKIGTLIPKLPTLQPNFGRLLPQTFRGGMIESREWAGLELLGAHLDQVTDRDQTAATGLSLNNKNRRFSGTLDAGAFDVAGAAYRWSDTQLTYQLARLEDVYQQHYLGLVSSQKGGWGRLKSDIRLFVSDDSGRANGGAIDNRALSAMATYEWKGNAISLGYQQMFGDSAFPYVDGTDPYLVNFVQVGDFAEKNERSWQVRYQRDLATWGVPGLTFMTRYIKGSSAEVLATDDGREHELDIELQYRVQSGPLKALDVRVRNAIYRADFTRDTNDTRVILSYPISIL